MIRYILDTWLKEIICIFKDQGAVLFCIILPIAYPVIYSWIYNNEVVRDVPVAIVDDSHSALSREFIQKLDASPDVSVSLYCRSIDEGKQAVGHGDVYGVVYFPEDFEKKVGRMEQAVASVYCDMSYMLTYKAIFQTCTNVAFILGDNIKAKLTPGNTKRQAEVTQHPLLCDEVQMFNTTGGYGNCVLPAVLVLIIQQAMLLAVGLLAGTDRERYWASVKGVWSSLFGKSLAVSCIFLLMLAYTTLVIPRVFGFVMMMHLDDWLFVMVPYVLACSFFSIALSSMVRYRENVILLAVFTSVPLLLLSGVSWPQSNIPSFWAGVAWVVPSTFAIRAYVRISSMGGTLVDVIPEIIGMWVQILLYGCAALVVIYRRRQVAKAHELSQELENNNDNERISTDD